MSNPPENIFFPGQEDIYLECHGDSSRPLFLLAPHENEAVANEYVAGQIAIKGGLFVILHQKAQRNIQLHFGQKGVSVDPNRIFTHAGARASLLGLNPGLIEDGPLLRKAVARAVALGRFILAQYGPMPPGGTIVTIHNNTGGYDDDGRDGEGTVSILRYLKRKQAGAAYIEDVFVGKGDEDDLFFITDQQDFSAMKKSGWNVVLQSNRVATLPEEDDGSLSVWSAMMGVRYINIEAQRKNDQGVGKDHLNIQKQMVDFVFQLLAD